MEIKYNNKTYNKIKELLADTTIADIDKFLFDNEKITLADFVNLQEQENKNDAKGSASNSGDKGSASNSGDWGSASNSGYWGSAINSGDNGSASNSGDKGSASNSGYWGSASNSGYWGSAINSGDNGSASNSGHMGSASNSGHWGSASNSGYWGSAINSGDNGSASNSGHMGSAINSGYWGSASNSGYWGSAINSGDWGSASNSGYWGVSVSNAIFGTVSNKAGLYSMVTEFVFDNLIYGENPLKEKIIKQNAKLIKFTKEMEGKYYTLLKNKIFEVVDHDGIKMIVTDRKDINGFKVLKGIIFGDYTIYNKQRKFEDIDKTFVVEKDGIFSHADTIEKAIADFRYKIANRDTSDFEYFKTTKDKISTDEIIKGYRVITGSCELGTKHFVEDIMGDKLKDSYTIDEALVILRTENAYAFEKFEKFVRGE